jgi:hypothetical protein
VGQFYVKGAWPFVVPAILVGFVIVCPAQEENMTARGEKRVPISLDGGASINPDVVKNVVDDTIGLTADDREAYFRILKLTEKLDPEDLRIWAREFREDRRKASPRYRQRPVEKFPTFVDLFQHPADYRGRPVSLHGYFRRLVTYDAGKNEQGFQSLFEGWFYPDEGQGNPAVIIFTEKPAGFPIGADITEEASVTGYFFKMYGYEAHDTTRKAPLILARTVRWRPQKVPARWTPSPLIYEREREKRLRQVDEFVLVDSSFATRTPIPSDNGSAVEPHH